MTLSLSGTPTRLVGFPDRSPSPALDHACQRWAATDTGLDPEADGGLKKACPSFTWARLSRFRAGVTLLLLCSLALPLCGCEPGATREQEILRALGVLASRTADQPMQPGDGSRGQQAGSAADRLNPLPFDEKTVGRGRESYALHCSRCHGVNTEIHQAVDPGSGAVVPDLRSPTVQGKTDGMLFSSLGPGSPKHPPVADMVTEEERWAIIRYLRYVSDPSMGWRA